MSADSSEATHDLATVYPSGRMACAPTLYPLLLYAILYQL